MWLRRVESDKFKAHCSICRTNFDVSHAGVNSVKVHEKGKRHSQLVGGFLSGKQSRINFSSNLSNTEQRDTTRHQADLGLLKPSTSGTSSDSTLQAQTSTFSPQPQSKIPDTLSCELSIPSSSVAGPTCSQALDCRPIADIKPYLIKDEVTKAEILWSLNCVMCHTSKRSGGSTSDLFPLMFADSAVAQNFKMHKDKLSYVITYGLGPFFQQNLVDDVKLAQFYAVSFDESLNEVAQKGQMDLVVRYWDHHKGEVCTRYLTSVFLNSATAEDLVNSFMLGITKWGLSLQNIIQISLDGPNVNLKFLRDIQQKCLSDDGDERKIFDVGTCSLHIVQGAYKTAHKESGWKVHEFLRALYQYFKNFPSRRSAYTKVTTSVLFPLKFCQIRWVENSIVLKRAIEMLQFLRKYVAAVEKHPPDSENFFKIKSFLADPLLLPKLEFMLSVSLQLEPFLTIFQSNDPLLPFLYEELHSLLNGLACRFFKKSVLADCNSATKMIALNPKDLELLKLVQNIDIGFGAKSALKNCKEVEVMLFKNECKTFLQHIFGKLCLKCPLKFKIVKGASCLSPTVISSAVLRTSRVNIALEAFIEKNQIVASDADCVKRDYLQFCDSPEVQLAMKSFDRKTQKLDKFLVSLCQGSKTDSSRLITFFQKILIMYHGNAAVERGFSVNKECLVENLEEDSLVALRSVHDAISAVGKLSDLVITKSLILAARNASARRQEALKAKQEKKSAEEKEKKRKMSELKELEMCKKRIVEQSKEEIKTLELKITNLQKQMKK